MSSRPEKTLIDVVYSDGAACAVGNDLLDILIATQKITRFRRADGWVDVVPGRTKLRDYRNGHHYSGPERRAPWPAQ